MATTKTYQPLVFRIRALTNLHPGGGDSFYGAVDKLVQRDPATNYPTIHGHSLKGALREYFESELGMDEWDDFIVHVFGSPVNGKPKNADPNKTREDFLNPGNYRFFGADLLALPVPDEHVDSSEAYQLETDDAVWKAFFDKVQLLGGKFKETADLKKAFQTGLPKGFGADKLKFKTAAEELPVVARNQLDNGKSENLWYEELVPHESVFGFVVQVLLGTENADDLNKKVEFTSNLHDRVVQIGANASVGYGFCLLTLINPPSNPPSQS